MGYSGVGAMILRVNKKSWLMVIKYPVSIKEYNIIVILHFAECNIIFIAH